MPETGSSGSGPVGGNPGSKPRSNPGSNNTGHKGFNHGPGNVPGKSEREWDNLLSGSTSVQDVLRSAAFAEQAQYNLARLLTEHPHMENDIMEGGIICRSVVMLSDLSRSFTDATRRDPSLLDVLRPPDALTGARDRETYLQIMQEEAHLGEALQEELQQEDMQAAGNQASNASSTPDGRSRASSTPDSSTPDSAAFDSPVFDIRVWKRKEMLRIMVRDVLGEADILSVTQEISALADACLVYCFEQAAKEYPGLRMAIVGMGKLGGNELNYSSDVDVVFVHSDEFAANNSLSNSLSNSTENSPPNPESPPPNSLTASQATIQVGKSIIAQMSTATETGVVFKVDTDLRPEGTAGALSRTPEGYRNYFTDRARPWERQAWIKARYVAGDREIANELLNAVKDFVWRPDLDPEEIRSIRQLKSQAEKAVAKSQGRNFKRGPGGIRDIEFSIQLLLLVHGRSDPLLRSPNTLSGIEALSRAGSIDRDDAQHLSNAYSYLRTLEHRLQLRDERAVYELPSDEQNQLWLARIMGHRQAPEIEDFHTSHERYVSSVRETQQRLFLRPTLEAIAGSNLVAGGENLQTQLSILGFREPMKAESILQQLTTGLSRTARSLQQLMPLMLSALAETPNPDLGLIRFDWVINGPHRKNTIVPALRDSPTSVERLSRLLGSSRVVADSLRRLPAFVRTLAEDNFSRSMEELRSEALAAITLRRDEPELRRDEVRRFLRRERLRVASGDILGLLDFDEIGHSITDIAESLSSAVLEVLEPKMPFCVIGLGSLGGQEMLYTSDMDVIFLYDSDGSGTAEMAQQTAKAWMSEMVTLTPEGRAWEVDVRLRPEGQQGSLAHTPTAYKNYWGSRARLWEFQTMLKARVVAGDTELGERFLKSAAQEIFAQRDSKDVAKELDDMRNRIATELHKGDLDLKRGPGRRMEITFVVQLLQLIYGAEKPSIHNPNTLTSLVALEAEELISKAEHEALASAFAWSCRASCRHHLMSGTETGSGIFPEEEQARQELARILGYEGSFEKDLGASSEMEADFREITASATQATDAIFSRHLG